MKDTTDWNAEGEAEQHFERIRSALESFTAENPRYAGECTLQRRNIALEVWMPTTHQGKRTLTAYRGVRPLNVLLPTPAEEQDVADFAGSIAGTLSVRRVMETRGILLYLFAPKMKAPFKRF